MNFSELNLNESLLKAIQKKGFSTPSEVQEKIIPFVLNGKDVVGKSRTGSGKTAAFGIPLLQKIPKGQAFAALIVVPTRELARQVKEEIQSLAIGSHIKTMAVFGQQSINMQMDLLDRNPEIIVGTPGRLLDLIDRGALPLGKTKYLILDEADKMFDMGFRPDVEKIISCLPKERQTLLFSATMPHDIMHLVERHMKRDKKTVDLSEDNAPVHEVEQLYVMTAKDGKIDALEQIFKTDLSKTLVFCRTKRTVDWLERQLYQRNIRTFAMHGDKTQNMRNRTLDQFKESRDGILIATDIVARGIHVDDIGLVVNFDFPEESDTYIHRVGRTARQGKKGKAITFCTNLMDVQVLKRLSMHNRTKLQELRF